MLDYPLGQRPEDQREAHTQEEFIELIRKVLQSGRVRSFIQSLIARSNEETKGHDQGRADEA